MRYKIEFSEGVGKEDNMPHSLAAKLSGLRHKGCITDTEYHRLRTGLRCERAIRKAREELLKFCEENEGTERAEGVVHALDVIDFCIDEECRG